MTKTESEDLRDDKGIQLEKVTIRLYKGDVDKLRELLPSRVTPTAFIRATVRKHINGLTNVREEVGTETLDLEDGKDE